MSKNHLKSPPALSFSGALSATLQDHLQKSCVECAFPEHARPLPRANILTDNLFRTIVGHPHVESPNFAAINNGKGIWQEQSLT